MNVRTVQERLRADHICTLELLDKATKENDALKATVAKLKKRLNGNKSCDVVMFIIIV